MIRKILLAIVIVVALLAWNRHKQNVSKGSKLTEPADASYVYLEDFSKEFVFDLRYATENNFLKKKVYPCAECMLAYETVKGLIKANDLFVIKGYKIKIFDCYRPRFVQYKMWEILPDSRYVANPEGKGSAHNRGLAVDLTLITMNGKELDMGTGFDHFGEEAHHAYTDLPDTVIQNRMFLKTIMRDAGFNPIKTEWWHYYLITDNEYEPADFPLCREE
ncbi:MAG: M15 family metallopeptidase [Bacteroidota bacterium]